MHGSSVHCYEITSTLPVKRWWPYCSHLSSLLCLYLIPLTSQICKLFRPIIFWFLSLFLLTFLFRLKQFLTPLFLCITHFLPLYSLLSFVLIFHSFYERFFILHAPSSTSSFTFLYITTLSSLLSSHSSISFTLLSLSLFWSSPHIPFLSVLCIFYFPLFYQWQNTACVCSVSWQW